MTQVLVIEDDCSLSETIEFLLQDSGYSVTCRSQTTTFDDVLTSKPDIMIVDVNLPGMQGDEFTTLLKENPLTAHIPVLLTSAVPDLPKKATACKADGCISKPFDIEELLSEIERLTQASQPLTHTQNRVSIESTL